MENFDSDISFDDMDLDFDDEQFNDTEEDNAKDFLDAEEEYSDGAEDYSDGAEDYSDGAEDYSDGAIIEDLDLKDDSDSEISSTKETDFISESGNIVVQDTTDDESSGFNIAYIDIENIAITKRIRNLQSVEGLVQSIKSTGLLEPLVVAPTATEGVYVLLAGFRRIQACARAGKKIIPCVINNKVNTPEIPILEAMYNHSQKYSVKEQVDYIEYLEKQKGIMNPAMIEYLLQMNSGDYTKLKDIINDNDDDIVNKLYEGTYDIATAFRKLEQRRKKESLEEKENRKAARVYDDEAESGADQITGSGDEVDGSVLTEEQIASLAINAAELDNDIEDASLNEMLQEDKDLEGFKPHKQKVGEREYIDPVLKKSVMARDNSTCQCCKRGGEQYVDILDYHHILPVFLGGDDSIDNGIMLCVSCHRLVHLYSTDDLHVDKALLAGEYKDLTDLQKERYANEEIFEDEKLRFKRVIKLGSMIRKGMVARGMNKEQYKKEHSNAGVGRRKPGVNAEQETS